MIYFCDRNPCPLLYDGSYWYFCVDDSEGGDMGKFNSFNLALSHARKIFRKKKYYMGRGHFSDLDPKFHQFLRSLKNE